MIALSRRSRNGHPASTATSAMRDRSRGSDPCSPLAGRVFNFFVPESNACGPFALLKFGGRLRFRRPEFHPSSTETLFAIAKSTAPQRFELSSTNSASLLYQK